MVNPKHRLLNHSKTIVNPTEECKQKIKNLGVYSKTIVNPNKHIVNHEKNTMVNQCETMLEPWQIPGKTW